MAINSMYTRAELQSAQEQFAQRQQELEERLSGDLAVCNARTKLESAQWWLNHLQNQMKPLPYDQRVKYLNDLAAKKQAVTDAQRELQTAINENSKMYHQIKIVEQQAQEEKRLAEQQAAQANALEAEALAQYTPHYLASGGTRQQLAAAWPDIYKGMVEQKAAEKMAVANAAHYDL